MKSLIKIEWLKIKKYPVFWWMLGIVALTYPGINLMFYYVYQTLTDVKINTDGENSNAMATAMFKMLLGEPYAFPEVWHSIAYFSSWFIMVPSILVVMLINNEYTYKTNRQNIIDGWSRDNFVMSKLMAVAIISLVITIMYIITTLIFGLAFDAKLITKIWQQLYYIPLFFLQTFAQLSIAFMLGFFIKKAFLAIGVFLMYFFIIENIFIVAMINYKIDLYKYFPLEISDRLIPPVSFIGNIGGVEKYNESINAIPIHVVLTILLTSGIWYLCFYNYKRRDL